MKNITETVDLQAQNIQLNTQLAGCDKRIAELENTVAELTALVEHFKELFKLSQLKRFGASSEKGVIGAEQLSLMGDFLPSLLPIADETETVTISPRKRKSARNAVSRWLLLASTFVTR